MYCPRCGKPAEPGEKICSNCHLEFEAMSTDNNANFSPDMEPPLVNVQLISERLRKVNIKLICFSLIALSILIITFLSADKVSNSAYQITQIRSSSANTINEVYYREMGNIYTGYAMFIRECGIFFATVLVGLGLKQPKQ
jgi:predicted nucleic acid-binding Zn ribbon protein